MDEKKRLSQNLTEFMRVKGLNAEKLAQLTGVSERYIEFILEEKFNKLPAAPYVRGYINRISQTLDLEPEKIWQEYLKDNESIHQAGKGDRMPENRFLSKTPISKPIFILGSIIIIAVIALTRTVYVNNPKIEFHNLEEDITIVKESKFIISGKIDPAYKLTLNNSEIFLNKDGSFEKEVSLEPSFNTFTFKAKKILGREHSIVKQIFYQAPEPTHSFSVPSLITPEDKPSMEENQIQNGN